MSDEEVGASGELSMAELVQKELKALRAVDGVTSATAKGRSNQRKPLNSMVAKVRLQGRDDALTVHCSKDVPNLLAALQKITAHLIAIVGEAAVAEGRRRAEAAAPASAPAAAAPASAQAGASTLNFFECSRRVQQLEAQKLRAQDRVCEADSQVKVARLRVAAEQKNLDKAAEKMVDAVAQEDAASASLLEAKAAAAEVLAELDSLRSKRQRLAEEPLASTDAGASEAAETQPTSTSDARRYMDYTLETFRRLESDEIRRRSIVPERGVQSKLARMGKAGALEHHRRGLVGAVQSWANGSIDNVIMLMMYLINHFDISAEILKKLEPHSGVCCPGCQDPPCCCPRRGR